MIKIHRYFNSLDLDEIKENMIITKFNYTPLLNPESVFEYLCNNCNLPNYDEFMILTLDIKLVPLKNSYHKYKDGLLDVLNDAYYPKAASLMLLYHDTNKKPFSIIEKLELMGFDVVDTFSINKERYLSSDKADRNISSSKKMEKYKRKISNKSLSINYYCYDEILNLYLDNQLVNSKTKDFNKIIKNKNIINIFMNLDQEYFGMVLYDENDNYLNAVLPFKGGLNSSVVDARILIKFFIVEKVKKIVLFHNHPSGDNNPSEEDISLTIRLNKILKYLNKSLIDHYIIGKDNILSLKDKKYISLD